MKRKGNLGGIFAMALILMLTLVLSVGSVSAAEPNIVDSRNCGKDGSNVTWTLDSAGLLTISGTGEMADYESKTDSASGEEITTAPWGNQAKTVVIGDGVTGIGAAAFYGCSGLTSVTMGSNVTSIGESAFCGCTGLTAIEIPEGVTTLGNSAFFGCDNLKEIRYNARAAANLTGLSGAFRSAGASVGGVKVIFGESVEKIPSNLFCNCESLTSVTIGSNVTSIGDNAFLGCKGLVEINYNARAAECTEDSFGSGDGLKVTFGDSVERIPDYIFQDCSGLTSVTIGSSATTIGHYAFNRCTGLTSIKIPESMTNIGYMAFSGCMGLADVYYGGSERQWNAITIDDGNDRLLQANRHCEGKETLVSPTAKPSYVGASGKPYIYWSAVDGANRYYVYRSTTKDGTYSFLGSTAKLNYTDSKADAGTTYYYKVKAGIVNGVKSNSSAAVAITCRCARPVVKPSYVGASGKPYIYWSAVDGAGKYYVYRSTSKDGTYEYIGYTTKTNYTDSKANAGYTYYYKVQAISSVLTMAKVYLSPSNQTDNCYAYGNTNEAVQCGKIADSCRIALERSGVTVQVGHMPSMQDKCKESNAFGADLHVPIHTNAFNGTVTGTRMFCLNSSGEGMKACEAIFAWLAPITPGTSENIQVDASLYEVRVPSAPTAYVECEFHDNATTAKWIVEHTVDIGEAIARGICDYFGVTYKEKEQPESAASTDKLYRAQEGAFANRPIAEEKNTANSSLSAAVAITCRCARPVVKPSYVGASGKPYIYWGAVDGANRYYVYRSTTKDGTYSFLGSTANLNYTDSKADAGTTYYYKVKAGIVNGVKINSSAAVAITCRCARPSVKITTSNGSPRLTWNAVAGANKYYIYRSTEANGIFEYLYSTKNLFYTNKSAVAGTTYYYKVKAVSKVKNTANSAFSTVVSIRAR
jgi:fibronectin type 3 domain-containing protein